MTTTADFVKACNWVVKSNKDGHLKWHYLQSRPIELDMRFPKRIDCSGTFTFIYRMLGLKDPNGFGYSGIGNTAILIQKGRLIKMEDVTPGDAIIFCPDDDITKQHVSMAVEAGKKDPMTLSMGCEGDPSWAKPSQDGRPFKAYTFDKKTVQWPPYDFSSFNPPVQLCHPSSAPMRRPIIKLGAQGMHVEYLQRKLNITVDGNFSIITEKAVKIFQQKNKLEADGIVGPKTWALLK